MGSGRDRYMREVWVAWLVWLVWVVWLLEGAAQGLTREKGVGRIFVFWGCWMTYVAR